MSLCLLLTAGSVQALPFAATLEGVYRPGENTNPDYQNPAKALGEPALDTGFGDVTPFNGPFSAAELVQVGAGGELIIGFDHRVLDDPLNPFGIDLLVFGNAFFFNPDFSGPVLALDLFAEEGMISVSQDLATWVPITSVVADGLFPTQGYLDTTGPFANDGTLKADFTLPVDPSIDWVGADFATIVALYAGSGGGAGVDLAETALPWIQYVKISVPAGSLTVVEIDAFSDVPEPEPLVLSALGLALLGCLRRRRRIAVESRA